MSRATKPTATPAQTEAWQQISVSKLSPSPVKASYGQTKRPDRPMSVDASKGRHATCVEHLEIAGLREPVCVQRGQDPEQVRREAMELAGVRS